MHAGFALVALAAFGSAGSAPAQGDQALPDPATIALPAMTSSRDPKVAANGWKYFYFHKAGVGFTEAHADLADCYRFLEAGPNSPLPTFVPWHDRPGRREPTYNPQFGLVGAIIGGMIEGTIVRRNRQSKMRRCMEPRGYQRYAVAEDVWRQLVEGDPRRSIAMQAKIAAGPTPDAEIPRK